MRQTLRSRSPVQRGMNPASNSRNDSKDEEAKPSYDDSMGRNNRENSNSKRENEEDVSNDPKKFPIHQQNKQSSAKDGPFGDEADADVKYKSMERWQAYMLMTAEAVSVGILSLPSVLATVGILSGIIFIAGWEVIATYTGYTI
jgi:hypothetical protein